MSEIESTRLHYIELGKFSLSLVQKMKRREPIENYNIKFFGGSARYVVPPVGKTMLSLVEQYSPRVASTAIERNYNYCYVTYNECIYYGKIYEHSDYDIQNDFFALSTIHNFEVLKVLTLGSIIYKELCKDIESMVLLDFIMIESYYQYLIKEYGSAY